LFKGAGGSNFKHLTKNFMSFINERRKSVWDGIAQKISITLLTLVSLPRVGLAQEGCVGQTYRYDWGTCNPAYYWTIDPPSAGSISVEGDYAYVTWYSSGTLNYDCGVADFVAHYPPSGSIVGPNQTACSGDQVSYLASTSGTSLNWTLPGSWTLVSGQGTGQIWANPNGNSGTVILSFVGSDTWGCPSGASKSVSPYTTSGALSISSSSGPASLCESQSGYYTAYALGAASYSWQFTTSTGTVLASGAGTNLGDGSSGYWIYPSGPGSFRVKVQAIPGSGCGQSNSSVGTMGVTVYASNSTHCGGGGNRTAADNAIMTFDEDLSAQGISIYPNPASKFIHVNFGSPVKDASIKLTSLSAEIVANVRTSAQENRLGIEHVSNGFYIIEVVNGNSILRKKIFIKQ
jgi:hypothetical protein